MKNIKKTYLIIIILVLTSLIFPNYLQASEIGNIFKDADEFLVIGDPVGTVINTTELKDTSDFMFKLLTAIGIVVMFIVGTIIGIKFMISSAEDKAKVKESLIPYIVGCCVIFGAFTIWGIVVDIGQDVTGESSAEYAIGKIYYQCQKCYNHYPYEYCYYCNTTENIVGKEIYKCQACYDIISKGDLRKNGNRCDNCGIVLKPQYIEYLPVTGTVYFQCAKGSYHQISYAFCDTHQYDCRDEVIVKCSSCGDFTNLADLFDAEYHCKKCGGYFAKKSEIPTNMKFIDRLNTRNINNLKDVYFGQKLSEFASYSIVKQCTYDLGNGVLCNKQTTKDFCDEHGNSNLKIYAKRCSACGKWTEYSKTMCRYCLVGFKD